MVQRTGDPVASQGFLPGRHVIDSYGNGGFRFGDMSHKGSILALPSGIHAWSVTDFATVARADFALVMAEADQIDTLLIGTGVDMALLPEALRWRLKEGRMAVDSMSTGAAARIYNIMVSENRRVAAALIAVS
jgi:uncharacterized protein